MPAVSIDTGLARVGDEWNQETNVAHGIEDVGLGKLSRPEAPEGFDEPLGGPAGVAGEEVRVERPAGPRLTRRVGRAVVVARTSARMLSQTPRPMPLRG